MQNDPAGPASRLDHVAVLVSSLDGLAPVLARHGLAADGVREFPKEGTRETYVSGGRREGRLLLVEAAGPGPYSRALEKRGPGLHHIAVAVASLAGFTGRLASSGWLVHPYSLRGNGRPADLWLCRHGVPTLVEVLEDPAAASPANPREAFISSLDLALEEHLQGLFSFLDCPAIHPGAGLPAVLHTCVGLLSIDELLRGGGRGSR